MPTTTVKLRNIPDTEAAVGWAGGHTIVVDRPEGKAGGIGLGFNGGPLLALAIGGCFCNDLRYVAHDMGAKLETIEIEVDLNLRSEPLLVIGAVMRITATATDPGVDVDEIIKRAKQDSTVANSIKRGFPVEAIAGLAG